MFKTSITFYLKIWKFEFEHFCLELNNVMNI